ncbi:MAG: hypothetical protein MZV70_01250 [Desulfobacterales bacterium]|nr:hypothetical protein [Desulfobacterales bacterium]
MGGIKVDGTWTRSEEAAVNLFPPHRYRLVDVIADEENVKAHNIKLITVAFKNRIFDREKTGEAKILPSETLLTKYEYLAQGKRHGLPVRGHLAPRRRPAGELRAGRRRPTPSSMPSIRENKEDNCLGTNPVFLQHLEESLHAQATALSSPPALGAAAAGGRDPERLEKGRREGDRRLPLSPGPRSAACWSSPRSSFSSACCMLPLPGIDDIFLAWIC